MDGMDSKEKGTLTWGFTGHTSRKGLDKVWPGMARVPGCCIVHRAG